MGKDEANIRLRERRRVVDAVADLIPTTRPRALDRFRTPHASRPTVTWCRAPRPDAHRRALRSPAHPVHLHASACNWYPPTGPAPLAACLQASHSVQKRVTPGPMIACPDFGGG